MSQNVISPQNDSQDDTLNALIKRVDTMPLRRKVRGWGIVAMAIIVFFAIIVYVGMSKTDTSWFALFAFWIALAFGALAWTETNRQERQTILNLAGSHDLRALSSLLNCIKFSNRRVRKIVEASIIRLLEQLTEENAPELNHHAREDLNALIYGNSEELAMAALRALEIVGDSIALPYLSSLAAGKATPVKLRHRAQEVQAQAQHSLARVNERIERQKHHDVLLRASQIPDTPSQELLRATVNNLKVNTQELLRPDFDMTMKMEKDKKS